MFLAGLTSEAGAQTHEQENERKMITSLDTTNPREVSILCNCMFALVWAEYFINQSTELAKHEPDNPHLEVLDALVNLYFDHADRYIPHISTDIAIELTRASMRGEYTLKDALFMQREGIQALQRATAMGL